MLQLVLMGLALYGLAALAKPQLSRLEQLSSPPWPKQQATAVKQGSHYFWTVPISNPNAQMLATAIHLMGWDEVQVFVPGRSIKGAPMPAPNDWRASKDVRVVGRWTGQDGAPVDMGPLKALGAADNAQATMWIPTEAFIAQYAAKQ